jgi:hypothetical protein
MEDTKGKGNKKIRQRMKKGINNHERIRKQGRIG